MALTTQTIPVGATWTLVTNKVSSMSFNGIMEVFITNSTVVPTENLIGFKVAAGTPYKNCSPNIRVYARHLGDVTKIKSVRLVGEV